MPRRPRRSVPIVIVPGWQGSPAGHWQVWLAERLGGDGRDVVWPALPEPERPRLASWLAALRDALAPLAADGYDVVTHSLGAVLWLHHVNAPGDAPRPSRVALVSPPSPGTALAEVAAFFPPPLDVDRVRAGADGTVLVAGSDDPYLPEGIAAAYGAPLKIATTVVEGGGHLNIASGHGEWPAMLDWCRRDNLAFF